MYIRKIIKYVLIILITYQTHSIVLAEEVAPYLIDTGGETNCKQGLYIQPGHGNYIKPNGPFSIYLFCDLAFGNNIGIICTEPGAGPGKIELKSKSWEFWQVYNRFWQDSSWATDVTSFAWSPSGKYIYVATNSAYGDGRLHQVDLVNKTSKTVEIKGEQKYKLSQYEGYTMINEIDLKKKTIKVTMHLIGADDKEIVLKDKIKLE